MPRDLASLELELGKFESDMDGEAARVFDHMDMVRSKAGDVFKRTHARVDASAKTVDRVDKLVTGLDRSNGNPPSCGSSKGSETSSDAKTEPPAVLIEKTEPPPVDSTEKKT